MASRCSSELFDVLLRCSFGNNVRGALGPVSPAVVMAARVGVRRPPVDPSSYGVGYRDEPQPAACSRKWALESGQVTDGEKCPVVVMDYCLRGQGWPLGGVLEVDLYVMVLESYQLNMRRNRKHV